MRRRPPEESSLSLLVCCAILLVAGRSHAAFVASELLGRPTDTSVTVNAAADQVLEVYFEYGTAPGVYTAQTTAATFAAGSPIEQVIDQLQPNTRYYYRMRYRDPGAPQFDARPEHSFHTQRDPGETFTFTVQADSHIYDKKGDHALYQVAMQNQAADAPDFFIDLGDTFGDDHDLNITSAAMLQLHLDQRPFLGVVGSSAPVFLSLGNHEGEAGYYLNVTPPNNLAIYGTLARQLYYPNPVPNGFYSGNTHSEDYVGLPENYYAWEWGDALFVVLDAYRHEIIDRKVSGDFWDWTLGDAQYNWLKQTLEQSHAKFKFVFAHHLLGQCRGGVIWANKYEWGGENSDGSWGFDAHRPGWAMPIHQLLVQNGVTIFFQGHDHLYAKEDLDGVVYQETPMPSDATYNVGGVNAGAYTGTVLTDSGHLRVTVAPSQTTVDYVRSFLPGDGTNGQVAYSYTVPAPGQSGPTPTPTPMSTPSTATPTAAPTSAPTATPSGPVFTGGELLGRPTDTSVTVNAVASQPLEVYYEYGTAPGTYAAQTALLTSMANTPFEVAISGLQPDTRYYYRMRYRSPGDLQFNQRDEHTFHTQRPPGSSFTFTVQADPHLDSNTNAELYQRMLANVQADTPDFHIDLGDTFMAEKFATNYAETVDRHLLARSYYDIIGHSAPLYLVLGNHEGEAGWYLDGAPNNIAVWAATARTLFYPNPLPDGFYAGNGTAEPLVGLRQNYYAWQWGNALFVVLDPYWYTTSKPSQSGDDWDWTLGYEQYSWLKEVLETSRAKFKFVFAHHLVGGFDGIGRGGIEAAPYYEWGGKNADGSWGFDAHRPGWAMPIHQLLVENHVAAFFHGHDHLYVKQDLDGIVYQEVPQPGNLKGGTSSAISYGYLNGVLLGSSGHLRLTVSPAAATVDYVRAYRAGDEDATHVNRSVEYSYTIARDDDADGVLDGADVCTTLRTTSPPASPPDQTPAKLRLSLTHLDQPAGSQGVRARGSFNPAATVPAVDPSANGVHVHVSNDAGEIYDVSIPGGLVGTSPCDPRDGWSVRDSRTTTMWRYTNRSNGLPDGSGGCAAGAAKGVARITVKDATRVRAQSFQFNVTGRQANLAATPGVPLTRLQFDFALAARSESQAASPQEIAGQCTEYVFTGSPIPSTAPSPYCRVSPTTGIARTIRCAGL